MMDIKPDLDKVVQPLVDTGCKPPTADLDGISEYDLHTILRSSRRKALLFELATAPNYELEFTDAIDTISEYEFGEGYSHKERKRVYAHVKQTHIPLMKKHDVIECERATGTIRLGKTAVPVLKSYYLTVAGLTANHWHLKSPAVLAR